MENLNLSPETIISCSLPSLEDAGVIAAKMTDKLDAFEQCFFIAGFQECIKYIQSEKCINKERKNFTQLCPKCNGEGYCPEVGTSTNATRVCPVCQGAKLI